MTRLSVIIPTADRQDYAAPVVSAIRAVCPHAEIVVSDTSSDASLAVLLADEIAAGTVVYLRPGVGIDVVSNFEAARQAATGDYLMFLGDDDCVGPGIMAVVEWAAANAVEAVVSYTDYFLASYFWPGVTSRYFGDRISGALFIKPFTGAVSIIDPRSALKDALARFGSGLGAMPRAYHGLVSRALADRIAARHGRLFGGVSPDIFSATLIAMNARTVARVDWPFCIPGGSPRSTAGLGAAQTDRSVLWTNPHIAPFKGLVWDPLIPEFYSPTTVWAFSFKAATDLFPGIGLAPNLDRLYAHSLVFNRRYFNAVMAAWRRSAVPRGWFAAITGLAGALTAVGATLAAKVAGRVGNFRPGGRNTTALADLPDIAAAYSALEHHIAASGLTLQLDPLS